MKLSNTLSCFFLLFTASFDFQTVNGEFFRHMFMEPFPSEKTVENEFFSEISQPKTRVVNGNEAQKASLPYQAYLVFNGTFVVGDVSQENVLWLCGGSLISKNYVLTAAHCVDGAHTVLVYLGAHNLSQNETSRLKIETHNVTIHEKYNKQRIQFDIGLVRLPEPINYTSAIQPIKLPPKRVENITFSGLTATVSGFGKTDGFATSSVTLLQSSDFKVLRNDKCSQYFTNVIPEVICTSGQEMRGICSGDSGGPLVYQGIQIGIVSYSVVYCLPGYPGGYARVTSFLNWLEQHTDAEIEK